MTMLRNPTSFFPCSHAPTGTEELPRPGVLLVRHRNLKGPIRGFLSLREHPHIWVLDRFFRYSDCYEQYRSYTLSRRRGKKPKVFSLSAAVAAALVVPLLHCIRAVPVYRGSRSIEKTFQQSISLLKQKKRLLIAADKSYDDESSPVTEIYTGFFRLESLYFEETGEHLPFFVLHFKKDGSMICSPPIFFHEKTPFRQQRRELTNIVIQYLNGQFQS